MSVYFITCRQTGTVKIGSSLEPLARLREIQTGHPFELKVEAVLPGGCEEEFDFHRRFAEERLKGEWFTITDMIELIIKNNPVPPPVRIPTREEVRARLQPFPVVEPIKSHARNPLKSSWGKEGGSYLAKRVKAGDIHFPFRAGAKA
jgi:hypothetical protein